MPHGHSHGGSCEHEASDADNALEMGFQYSLYSVIDTNNLECLNEEQEGTGKTVFKPYEDRLDFSKYVQSNDGDEELLFNIPFTGNVKLKGFIVIGANDDSHPSKIRLFKNRPKMTFDEVSAKPDQEFELFKDSTGTQEYPTRVVTFSSVHHLTLHFPSNFGGDETRIYYIGLRGEYMKAHRHGVTICNYELKPNVADHKNDLFETMNHQIQ